MFFIPLEVMLQIVSYSKLAKILLNSDDTVVIVVADNPNEIASKGQIHSQRKAAIYCGDKRSKRGLHHSWSIIVSHALL